MRVTSKGQVTIPQHFRKRTDIRPGSEVDFAERDGELIVRKATAGGHEPDAFADYLDSVTGIVDLGMTTDAFMDLIRGE
ncbi:AbrB/MazE/SpoVT family DNA-binding domain-containing protein [Microbaculum sp. FT89]|uniref:AbrB/MazE/SpoVT family DNA-binding domain-containing protein n=1 Tax=Microbaculum sp. FT89 TaxID=3447298 RepID=UPI003F530A33